MLNVVLRCDRQRRCRRCNLKNLLRKCRGGRTSRPGCARKVPSVNRTHRYKRQAYAQKPQAENCSAITDKAVPYNPRRQYQQYPRTAARYRSIGATPFYYPMNISCIPPSQFLGHQPCGGKPYAGYGYRCCKGTYAHNKPKETNALGTHSL